MAQKEEIDVKEFKLRRLEITVYDENGEKLNNEDFRIIFSDGTLVSGQLEDGILSVENVPELPYILIVDGYVVLEEEE